MQENKGLLLLFYATRVNSAARMKNHGASNDKIRFKYKIVLFPLRYFKALCRKKQDQSVYTYQTFHNFHNLKIGISAASAFAYGRGEYYFNTKASTLHEQK